MEMSFFGASSRSPLSPRSPPSGSSDGPAFSTSPSLLHEVTSGGIPGGGGGSGPSSFGFGKSSPIKTRVMKEFDQQLSELRKENFNLKLRIYFLEERLGKSGVAGGNGEDLQKANIELKVETENLRRELQRKQSLLTQASGALEALEKQRELNAHERKQEAERYEAQILELQQAMEKLKVATPAELIHMPDEPSRDATGILGATYTEDEVNELRGRILELEGQVGLLHKEILIKEEDIHSIGKNLENIKQELEDKSEKLVELETEMTEKENRIDSLVHDLETRHKEISEKNNRIQTLTEDLQVLEPEIVVKRNELEERDRIIEEKNSQLEQQQKILVEIQITLDEKQKELEEYERKLNAACQKISDLEAQLHKAHKAVQGLTTSIEKKEAENKKKEKKIRELTAQLREAQDMLNKARWEAQAASNASATASLKDLADEENERLWAQLEEKEKLLSSLQATREEAQHQLEALQSNIMVHNDKVKCLEDEKAAKEQELTNLKDVLAKLLGPLCQLDLNSLQAKAEGKLREMAELQKTAACKDNELDNIKKQLRAKDLPKQSFLQASRSDGAISKRIRSISCERENKENQLIPQKPLKEQNHGNVAHSQYVHQLQAGSMADVNGLRNEVEHLKSLMQEKQQWLSEMEKLRTREKLEEKLRDMQNRLEQQQQHHAMKEREAEQQITQLKSELESAKKSSMTSSSSERAMAHIDNTRKYKKAVTSLQKRLAESHTTCDLLRTHLEQLADFLEHILNMDSQNASNMNGRLSPSELNAIKVALDRSRQLSNSLSQSLVSSPDCLATNAHLSSTSWDESFSSSWEEPPSSSGLDGIQSGRDSVGKHVTIKQLSKKVAEQTDELTTKIAQIETLNQNLEEKTSAIKTQVSQIEALQTENLKLLEQLKEKDAELEQCKYQALSSHPMFGADLGNVKGKKDQAGSPGEMCDFGTTRNLGLGFSLSLQEMRNIGEAIPNTLRTLSTRSAQQLHIEEHSLYWHQLSPVSYNEGLHNCGNESQELNLVALNGDAHVSRGRGNGTVSSCLQVPSDPQKSMKVSLSDSQLLKPQTQGSIDALPPPSPASVGAGVKGNDSWLIPSIAPQFTYLGYGNPVNSSPSPVPSPPQDGTKKRVQESTTSKAHSVAGFKPCIGFSASESEAWSEPDRSVSLARIGLEQLNGQKDRPVHDTSDSEDSENDGAQVMQRRARWEGGELRKLQGKIKSLEQVNAALQAQLSMSQRLPTSQEVQASMREAHGHSASTSHLNKRSDVERFCLSQELTEAELLKEQEQVRELEKAAQEAIEKCAEAELKLSQRELTLSRAQEKLKENASKISKYEESCKDLAQKLEVAEDAVLKLQSQVKDLEARLDEKALIFEEVNNLKQKLHVEEAKRIETEVKLRQYAEEFKKAKETAELFQEQLKEVKERLTAKCVDMEKSLELQKQEWKEKEGKWQEELNMWQGKEKQWQMDYASFKEKAKVWTKKQEKWRRTLVQVDQEQVNCSSMEEAIMRQVQLVLALQKKLKTSEVAVKDLQHLVKDMERKPSQGISQECQADLSTNAELDLKEKIQSLEVQLQAFQAMRQDLSPSRSMDGIHILDGGGNGENLAGLALSPRMAFKPSLLIPSPQFSPVPVRGHSSPFEFASSPGTQIVQILGNPRSRSACCLTQTLTPRPSSRGRLSKFSDYDSDATTWDEFEAQTKSGPQKGVPRSKHQGKQQPGPLFDSSPDQGIESDVQKFSSLESRMELPKRDLNKCTHPPTSLKSQDGDVTIMYCDREKALQDSATSSDQDTYTAEVERLKGELASTQQALEEALERLARANHRKEGLETAICRQLHRTRHILKRARGNMEEKRGGKKS